VEFAMSSGSGALRSNTSATTGMQVTVTTGSNGIASAAYLAESTPGSAVVTATLAAGSAQSVGFTLNVDASATVPAGGGGPVRPWAEQTPSQTGSNAQGEDGMVLEVTAKSYTTSYLNGNVVSPPNTATYTTGEVFTGSFNLNALGYYGGNHTVWNLPNDANFTLGDRRSVAYAKFVEQAFGGSVSFSGPPQPLPQLKRGEKVRASAGCIIVRTPGAWERHDEAGSAIKVLLKNAPEGSRRSYLILHQRQTMVFSWTNWFQFGGLATVGAGSVIFSKTEDGGLKVDLDQGTLAQGIAKKVGNALEITPLRPGEETSDSISLLPIEVKLVNRDDPTKTWTTGPVTSGPLAYTSPTISEVSDVKNGDLISWSVPGLTGGSFQWWATGPNNSRRDAASSVTTNEWKLDDPLDWLPGKWRIHCKHTPSSGSAVEFDFEQNLGYRSPHITVIGWINGNEVVLPDGSQPPNVRMWPQGTVPSPLSIGSIMGNFVTRNIFMLELVEGNVYPVPLSPDGARKYVNSHLIKYSPNTEPTSDFTMNWPGKANRKMVDLSALRDFKADKRLFRAFHQFQVRFELDESAKIKGEPVYLIPSSDTTECGYTPTDVVNLSSELGPLNNKIVKAGESLQINPKNGRTLTAKLPNDIAQINQGRISTLPIITLPVIGPINVSGGHVSKQVNNLVVPWIWSMITFSSSYASSGSTHVPQHEIFPSYHVLYNGRRIDSLTHHISSEKIEEFIQLGEAP